MKVLFVCDSNACRSQLAEAMLKRVYPDWEIYSAGVRPVNEIHWKNRAMAWILGLKIGHPKHWSVFSCYEFDKVIAFSEDSYHELKNLMSNIEYVPIPDPQVWGSLADFKRVTLQILRCLRREFL